MNYDFRKEACVENFHEALSAQKAGAHQIELCSQLDVDGCTPALKDVLSSITNLDILTKVMIRPVAGPFLIDDDTFMKMKKEISLMKELDVSHVVYGMTRSDRRLDIDRIAVLRDLAYPMHVTIHKAIDTSVNILEDLAALQQLGGIRSVLTSGGQPTAMRGMDMLKEMIHLAGQDIEVIPAGKITSDNIHEIHQELRAQTYHGRRIVPLT